jgi:hypothetical protein
LITCGSDNDQCIVGDNNGSLSIDTNMWFSSNDGGMAPHLITAYSGQIIKYDHAGYGGGQQIVVNLPVPRACLKGVRMFVTDHSGAVTFGAAVVGGGNVTAPIWCTGSNWVVG